jgi:LmbE family N-acetylglucosaminyl deacetylase
VIFLDHVDGELRHSPALQEELALWISRLRPDVVLSWDPWKRYMLHPDHREIGWGPATRWSRPVTTSSSLTS